MKEAHVFKPKARLMLLLGDELIRDAGIAVFELVKNAYDANATSCNIILNDIDQSDSLSAEIIVEDNGCGMSLDTIKDVWLEPGTDNRKTQRRELKKNTKVNSTNKINRLPLGEKGVGRFAVHKLGAHVQLITKSKAEQEVVVDINWQTFTTQEYLSDVPVKITSRDPEVFTGRNTGTRIIITDLRELPWTRGRFRDLHRAITSICSPFDSPDNFTPKLVKNFKQSEDWSDGLLSADDVLQIALYKFKGVIKGNELTYDYEFKPSVRMDRVTKRKASGLKEKVRLAAKGSDEIIELSADKIGPLTLEFHMYDLSPEIIKLTSLQPNTIKTYLKENGGIKVFRDGVRVYDFGEPENDWLNLGKRRFDNPGANISNNQVIGAVRLTQTIKEDSGLIDKTNREGFVDNEHYRKFRDAVLFALKQATAERNKDKDRIRRAYSKVKKSPVIDSIEELKIELITRKLPDAVIKIVDRIATQYSAMTERLVQAAGAGLNLMIILHEVEKRIHELHLHAIKGSNREELEVKAKELSDMVDSLTWLTRKSDMREIDSSKLINMAISNWRFRFKAHEIHVETNLEESSEQNLRLKVSRRLIMIALMNLIDNSIYWLQSRSSQRKIFIKTCYLSDDRPALVVADNGPGFKDAPHEVIEPFFTRKPDGMGLGLHIAEEIMNHHGGELTFPKYEECGLPKKFSGGAIVALEFKGLNS